MILEYNDLNKHDLCYKMTTSLTAPSDRTGNFKFKKMTLSDDEVNDATPILNKDIRFTQIEQHYADPPQFGQNICLVSFVPAKGARPDKDNIFGMMKVRGVYATEQEANERAEYIIRNVDSYHEIYHCNVGRPFPITTTEIYSNEIKTIDIRKKTTDIICEDILSKKQSEKQQIDEIKQREKVLLDESKKAQNNEPIDDFENYITEQVKRAQLIWTYVETKKKLVTMKESIDKSKEVLGKYDEENPDYITKYKDKYYQARKEAGLKDDENDESFMKYLGRDLEENIEELN